MREYVEFADWRLPDRRAAKIVPSATMMPREESFRPMDGSHCRGTIE